MPLQPPRTPKERLDWLRLIRSENVGPATFYALLRRFGDAARALQAVPTLARRGGAARPLRLSSAVDAEAELAQLKTLGARLLAVGEPAYPRALAAIDAPPPLIAARGQFHLFERRAIAIVGARNASAAGIRMARNLSLGLGEAGFVIVSGLARGVDAAAHDSAVGTGTIAVMAGGLDIIYPPENQALYETIAERGLLVSEMPLGTPPQARHFPRRNRLIAGLGLGTIVVEAAERSGSLITARYALEQNREVMAVPGSPLDPRARGANRLIREGAALIQDVRDVLDVLESAPVRRLDEPFLPSGPDLVEPAMTHVDDEMTLQPARQLIIERLGPTPVEIDELVRQTQQPPAIVLTVLLELELAGRLSRYPGQRVSLIDPD